jgi:hypothetical protein
LLAQSQVLQHQVTAGVKQAGERFHEQPDEAEHGWVLAEITVSRKLCKLLLAKQINILAKDGMVKFAHFAIKKQLLTFQNGNYRAALRWSITRSVSG